MAKKVVVLSVSLYSIILYLLLCLFLIYSSSCDYLTPVPLKRIPLFSLQMLPHIIIAFIILFVNQALWTLLSHYAIDSYNQSSHIIINLNKNNFLHVFFFVLQISVAACFEELLFRQFFPHRTKWILRECGPYLKPRLAKNDLLPIKCVSAFKFVTVEIVPVFAFALGHQYLGFVGFFNALVAGAVLRLLYKKTRSIAPGCIVHVMYNVLIIGIMGF
ncbi:MAG TPA: CPBP family intramembrane glutamic endopeptidase [Treponemataceae bacterium]|nr:CPBP family intramembrane glutamic endopeptidase [Treponemataceae bacterium]